LEEIPIENLKRSNSSSYDQILAILIQAAREKLRSMVSKIIYSVGNKVEFPE
jgi:hypothetical protein